MSQQFQSEIGLNRGRIVNVNSATPNLPHYGANATESQLAFFIYASRFFIVGFNRFLPWRAAHARIQDTGDQRGVVGRLPGVPPSK